MTDATFNCAPHALDYPVDNLEQLEAEGLENMLREGAVAVAEVAALAHEKAVIDLAVNAIVEGTGLGAALFMSLPTNPTNVSQIDWTPAASAAIATGGLSTFSGDLATLAGTFITGTAYRGAANPSGPKWWAGWTSYADN